MSSKSANAKSANMQKAVIHLLDFRSRIIDNTGSIGISGGRNRLRSASIRQTRTYQQTRVYQHYLLKKEKSNSACKSVPGDALLVPAVECPGVNAGQIGRSIHDGGNVASGLSYLAHLRGLANEEIARKLFKMRMILVTGNSFAILHSRCNFVKRRQYRRRSP
jgi:hypothetical protein